jgi:mannose-1-phosphate guanylyltransferase
MNVYTVIMAGGIGARFWPRSREKKPKQLLKLFGEKTLIRYTYERMSKLTPDDKILVITNSLHRSAIIEELPEVPKNNVIAEPFGKNTAACIALACSIIKSKELDAIMVIVPSDHLISKEEVFLKNIKEAIEYVKHNNALATIGISPTRPETGYGYIQIDEKPLQDNVYKVLTFAEKPNYDTALRFLQSGDFLWNSGMFVWKVSTIEDQFKIHMPDLYDGMRVLQKAIDTPNFESVLTDVYGRLKSISIDYGVMEKSSIVCLIKGEFVWSDVGTWSEVYNLSPKDEEGNAIIGDVFAQNVKNSYIYSPKKFSAVIGVDNLIVVNTAEALLICSKDKSQDVKNVIKYLKIKKLAQYL